MHPLLCCWWRAASEGIHLVHLRFNVTASKNIPQVENHSSGQLTLAGIDHQPGTLDPLEHVSKMGQMLSPLGAIDDHIVDVGSGVAFSPPLHLVHHALKGRRSAMLSKRHGGEVEQPGWSPEGGQLLGLRR